MKLKRIDPFQTETGDAKQVVASFSFLQTPFWAEFKAAHGWKALYFIIEESPEIFLSVLIRPFSRFASIVYIPLGPNIPCQDPETQTHILSDITAALKPYIPANSLFIRFDPPWGTVIPNRSAGQEDAPQVDSATESTLFPRKLIKPAQPSPAHIQPPDSVILDLAKSPDMLLSEMKSKWRYNIKLGEKKGIIIRFLEGEQGALEGINIFFKLYLETAHRDGIAIHSKEYYSELILRAAQPTLRSAYDKPLSVRVYIAEHEGTALASIITLFCGDEAVYLYGASSNEKRNLMPAYSLQWRAINDAIAFGCNRYDFYGIPPTNDETHPMHGLYRFKTGFGGSIIHRVGSYDIVLRPVIYFGYRIAEAARSFWYKKAIKILKKGTLRKS